MKRVKPLTKLFINFYSVMLQNPSRFQSKLTPEQVKHINSFLYPLEICERYIMPVSLLTYHTVDETTQLLDQTLLPRYIDDTNITVIDPKSNLQTQFEQLSQMNRHYYTLLMIDNSIKNIKQLQPSSHWCGYYYNETDTPKTVCDLIRLFSN